MGRMLFWGQQGVSPDIQTAVKHYERGATKLHDPVSMYDYAIVLLTVRILCLCSYMQSSITDSYASLCDGS